MTPRSGFSPQTESVLAALSDHPSEWHHGYEVAKETGLKSGTLYPILIRLSDRGLLEAAWEAEQVPGRPRRHLYRLTAQGLAAAEAARARVPSPSPRPERTVRRALRVPDSAAWPQGRNRDPRGEPVAAPVVARRG